MKVCESELYPSVGCILTPQPPALYPPPSISFFFLVAFFCICPSKSDRMGTVTPGELRPLDGDKLSLRSAYISWWWRKVKVTALQIWRLLAKHWQDHSACPSSTNSNCKLWFLLCFRESVVDVLGSLADKARPIHSVNTFCNLSTQHRTDRNRLWQIYSLPHSLSWVWRQNYSPVLV